LKLNDYILTFESTHNALATEKILRKKELDIELIPTPREISSECGFTLILENTNLQTIKDNTKKEILGDIYVIIKKGKRKKYEKVD
jgi:hypothetical protein